MFHQTKYFPLRKEILEAVKNNKIKIKMRHPYSRLKLSN